MTVDLTQPSSRYLALDGLRGIAALGIAIMHAYTTHTFWLFWSLVDLFFVLSGFLIGSILLDSRVNVMNFLMRRALRIWPVYYVTFAAAIGCTYLRIAFNSNIDNPTGVVASLFFLQFLDLYGLTDAQAAVQIQTYVPWFRHSWTLAMEQQFYVLLPMLLVLTRPSARRVIIASVTAIAGAVMLRATGQGIGVLAARADGFLLGVILAAFVSAGPIAAVAAWRWSRWVLPALGAVGVALVEPYVMDGYLGRLPPVSLPTGPFTVLGFALVYFALVGWVVTQQQSALSRALGNPLLVYLGTISYAIYMFHPLIQGFVGSYDRTVPIPELPVLVQVAMWFLIIGCSHLSKILLENRFNALKTRFPLYRRAQVRSPVSDSTTPLPLGR
jgi:peptidoglycan/LPS O-acetylase OafA/YrhL